MTLEGAEIIFELQQRDGAAAGQPPAATIRATMTAGYQLLTLSEPEVSVQAHSKAAASGPAQARTRSLVS